LRFLALASVASSMRPITPAAQKSLEKSKAKSGFTGAPDFLEISFCGAAVT